VHKLYSTDETLCCEEHTAVFFWRSTKGDDRSCRLRKRLRDFIIKKIPQTNVRTVDIQYVKLPGEKNIIQAGCTIVQNNRTKNRFLWPRVQLFMYAYIQYLFQVLKYETTYARLC
jgi:hypothetical protein